MNVCPNCWMPGILADNQIKELSLTNNMISPFIDRQVKENGVVSYGLSSYGYDVRISDEFKIIDQAHTYEAKMANYIKENSKWYDNTDYVELTYPTIIDPTEFDSSIFKDYKNSEIIIPAHGFVLGKTMEVVNIPKDVMVIALAKSTFARCGLVVGVTPLEPGFVGTVTIELSNTTNLPIRVKAGHGISQFLFFKGSYVCNVSYADRKGKYMYQEGVTLPKTINE